MPTKQMVLESKSKMEKAVEVLHDELKTVRTWKGFDWPGGEYKGGVLRDAYAAKTIGYPGGAAA